ncbi:MAG: DoxX family protein [Steroidobacteraceae bacterium]
MPALAGFYDATRDIGYTLVRIVIGITLFIHGWFKLQAGHAAITAYFASLGLPAPELVAVAAMFLETVGGLAVAVGLFTRFFAPPLAIEMLIALFAQHWANGFLVLPRKTGYEYVLLLGTVLFAIALRGGGPYSVDRAIGKEL